MTTEPDLLPCPFCGLNVTDDEGCFPLNRERTRWQVRCGNPSCFAYDPCDESMQAAVARWNRRATAAVDEAMVDRACGAYVQIADDCMGLVRRKAMRAALTAALTQQPAAEDWGLKTCYQCNRPVTWLAPDSRCVDCTRLTPDEVGG